MQRRPNQVSMLINSIKSQVQALIKMTYTEILAKLNKEGDAFNIPFHSLFRRTGFPHNFQIYSYLYFSGTQHDLQYVDKDDMVSTI